MKKIKVMRQSMMPVTLKNIDKYKEEFKTEYDKLYDEYEKDMETLSKKLDELDSVMHEKYPNVEEWDWIKSKRKWKELTKEYGPIALAHSETGDLVYVIMDNV